MIDFPTNKFRIEEILLLNLVTTLSELKGVYLIKQLSVSTPGRICLFGEHQDYLQLPIIAGAISLRISIKGSKRTDRLIFIDLPDINKKESFAIKESQNYQNDHDYFRSVVTVLKRDGLTFSNGVNCTVQGEIPINAGTSSSSALIVAWINFMIKMSVQQPEFTAEKIAEIAYRAEVLEFNEAGGMMDQYSTAVGGIIGLKTFPKLNLKKFDVTLGNFVLANSGEPKDTQNILRRVKNGVLDIVKMLETTDENFSLQTVKINNIDDYKTKLTSEQIILLKGTIRNREITKQAEDLLQQPNFDHLHFGALLSEQHEILSGTLKISTPKIDRMIETALAKGALGAKINGSGGGGCMFAYAPDNAEEIKSALEVISKETFVVSIGEGTRED
ncbi:MAG: hypothetical protein K9J12_15155 [Melioribacteraceae bacterium]|nr:hypothetical protein [Melioribacteraceae bacterium]MCF8263127.1 hypothetical protein [Melioribacteraceae bacterium]MCF8430541.1 hypothetical protein [Melioribacteraceae bacterium]